MQDGVQFIHSPHFAPYNIDQLLPEPHLRMIEPPVVPVPQYMVQLVPGAVPAQLPVTEGPSPVG